MTLQPTQKKTKPVVQKTESTNLKEYASLFTEVNKGIMPDRKKVALLNKLLELHKSDSLDDKEILLFKTLLSSERAKGTLSMAHTFILNKFEYDECELECYVRTKDAPPVYGLVYNTKCKYKFDATLGNAKKNVSVGRYVVYIPKEVPQEFQLNHKQALDKIEGREVDFNKVPRSYVQIHRKAFTQAEFEKYFGHDDEELIGNTQKDKAEYNF